MPFDDDTEFAFDDTQDNKLDSPAIDDLSLQTPWEFDATSTRADTPEYAPHSVLGALQKRESEADDDADPLQIYRYAPYATPATIVDFLDGQSSDDHSGSHSSLDEWTHATDPVAFTDAPAFSYAYANQQNIDPKPIYSSSGDDADHTLSGNTIMDKPVGQMSDKALQLSISAGSDRVKQIAAQEIARREQSRGTYSADVANSITGRIPIKPIEELNAGMKDDMMPSRGSSQTGGSSSTTQSILHGNDDNTSPSNKKNIEASVLANLKNGMISDGTANNQLQAAGLSKIIDMTSFAGNPQVNNIGLTDDQVLSGKSNASDWFQASIDHNKKQISVTMNVNFDTDSLSNQQATRLMSMVQEGASRYWSRMVNLNGEDYAVSTNITQDKNGMPVTLKVEPSTSYARSFNTNGATWPLSAPGSTIYYAQGWANGDPDYADMDFTVTSPHELGHAVLTLAGNREFSWGHEETSGTFGGENGGRLPKPNTGELDLMKYYENMRTPEQYARSMASESDVKNLIYVSKRN